MIEVARPDTTSSLGEGSRDPAVSALLRKLGAFRESQPEARQVEAVMDLIVDRSDCFDRHCFSPGHITGSALLVSEDNRRILMNHHAALGKWIGFGGHADGESDIAAVACRETREETGLQVRLLRAELFDVDIHPIPSNPSKGEPAHLHFDLRYLLQVVGSEEFTASSESNSLRWCGFEEALRLTEDASMKRLLRRWHALVL